MKNNMNVVMSSGFKKAYDDMVNFHAGQVRKFSGLDYHTHPLAVARYLAQYTDDIEILQAGMLHDTLEDCPIDVIELVKLGYSDRVIDLVKQLSKHYHKCYKVIKVDKTTEVYYNGLTNESWLIKLADRLHNVMFLDTDCCKKDRKKFILKYIKNTEELLQYWHKCKKHTGTYYTSSNIIVSEIMLVLSYLEMKYNKYHY